MVASIAAGFDQGVLERIVDVVAEHDMWSILLPLIALNPTLQGRIDPVIAARRR